MSRRCLPPLVLAPAFVRFLTALARERSVFLVGGWLRDGLRGAPAHDADFATDADAETVRRLADAHALKIFADKVAEQHGTYRMTSGRPYEVLDLATLRRDVSREGARHAAVAFTTDITQDLARRDLTINGMAAPYPFVAPPRGEVLDPFGGQRDLARRQLRLIGQATTRLEEDPLRLLRVARFACLGPGWHIEIRTQQALRKRAGWLRRISFERIRDELNKSLALPVPERFWRTVHQAGATDVVWPMPPSFRWAQARRALRHAACTSREPALRLGAFVVAGSRPRKHSSDVHQDAQQRRMAEAAMACWQRLRAPTAQCQELGRVAAAFPWRPQALVGDALTDWLLLHGQSPVAACRALGPALVRARLVRKAPLDALWRRVDRLLQGAPVPSLRELAIDGRTLTEAGLVKSGPAMGDLLRQLLRFGLHHRCWRDADALLAHATVLVRGARAP